LPPTNALPQADTFNLDSLTNPLGQSLITSVVGAFQTAMNPACGANLAYMVCHGWFKECKEVEDVRTGEMVWLPSLLCRSKCDQHWETWQNCLDDLEQNPLSKEKFDVQMQAMVMGSLVPGIGNLHVHLFPLAYV
jgi:hypothetical protein